MLFGHDVVNDRVLRCDHQVGSSEQRVGTSRKHRYGMLMVLNGEVYLSPLTLADPVALHFQCRRRPVQECEIIKQAFGILRDTQHPLAHRSALNGITLILPFVNFFIGKHRAQSFTPVHGAIGDVGKAMRIAVRFDVCRRRHICRNGQLIDMASLAERTIEPRVIHHQEHPLRPAVVFRKRGVHLARPVVVKADGVELTFECGNVVGCGDGRMNARRHAVALRWQTKRIEAHRVQHVESAHAFEPTDNVRGRVAFRVSNV